MLHRVFEFSNRLVIKRSAFGHFLSGPTHVIEGKDKKPKKVCKYFQVGNHRYYRSFTGETKFPKIDPSAVSSSGYVPLAIKPDGECMAESAVPSNAEINRLIRDYLKRQLDDRGEQGVPKAEHDQKVLETFINSLEREPDGRYVITLPWNDRADNVSQNRQRAQARINMLIAQFRKRKPEFEDFYTKAFNELIDLQFLLKLPMSFLETDEKYSIIPHQPVIKEYRETTKYRIVFAANEKQRGGYAINDSLESGPNLLKVIHTVLMRVRKGRFMFTQDLKKCFFQLKLSKRNRLRLLVFWTRICELTKKRILELYEFVRMPWGTNASMFCILAVILHHIWTLIAEYQATNPWEADRLKRMMDLMYVDDIIEVEDSEEDCVKGAEGNINAFALAAMPVTRTRSNSMKVREHFPEHAKDPEGNLVIKQGVLGMNWNMNDDTLSVNFDRVNDETWVEPFTRRKALAMQAKFFDPLDLHAPFYFRFKLLYREIEEEPGKLDWDRPVDPKLFKKFKDLFDSHTELKDISFPRNVLPWKGQFDVAIFCDASNVGYGVSAYVLNNGNPVLLRALSKIMKKEEIGSRSSSHQEIEGAAMAIKVRQQVEQAFPDDKINFYHFIDNMNCIYWIQSPSTHPDIYVSNRVDKIWKASEPTEWRHVPGKENPADLASRGVSAADLKKSNLWYHGPEWLKGPKEGWPQCRTISIDEVPDALEVKKRKTRQRKFDVVVPGVDIDKILKHLRPEDVKFDQLSDALVHIARWSKKVNKGPLKKINDRYKDERDFEQEPKEVLREYNQWIEQVKAVSTAVWALPERNWPGKDLSKPEVTLSVFSECRRLAKPELAYNLISPEERAEAGAILVRETQKHYFPNLWKIKGLEIQRDQLNTMEKKIHKQFNILFDEKLQVLLVSGRVTMPTPKEARIRIMTRAQQRKEELERQEMESDLSDDEIEEWEFEEVPADPLPYPRGVDLEESDGLKPTILLPGRGLVAESVIRDAHENCGHGGNQKILRMCRERIWIDSPNTILRKIQDQCRICRFLRAKLIRVAEGCLPKDRTSCTRPFGIVGVDMTGPIFISYNEHESPSEPPKKKAKKPKESDENEFDPDVNLNIPGKKGKHKSSGSFKKLQFYVMIITCCNTRNVNVQICMDLTAKEIGKAFMAFCAEEGRPDRVISDNAKQFKKLKKLYQEAMRVYVSPRCPKTYWKFIPSRAPWWGGFYESLIRPFKAVLRAELPRMRVRNYLDVHRLCKHAEACLNHRPLWAGLNSDTDVLAVTPFQFKSVEFDIENEEIHSNAVEISVLKQMKSQQTAAIGRLWHKVRMSMLTELQKFHDRRSTPAERTLKVDDLVLLKNDWSARSFWPIARITKVYPDARGIVRTVEVSKYVPNEINKELADSLYGVHVESKLNRNQLRQVTGFFKPLETPQAVKNLVRFEMWNFNEHPEQGAIIGRYGKKFKLPVSFKPEFENFSRPSIDEQNLKYRKYSVQDESITQRAMLIASINRPLTEDPELYDEFKEDKIACGV
jgi:hypothetical protein